MKNNASVTNDLRARATQAMGRCASCGRGGLTYQEAADEIGIPSASTLHRFLAGRSVNSETLDLIAAWVAKKVKREGRAK